MYIKMSRLHIIFMLFFGWLMKDEVYTRPAELNEGDTCEMQAIPGICTTLTKCTGLEAEMKRRKLTADDVVRCGLNVKEELICCITNIVSTDLRSGIERPALKACRIIESTLEPLLVPHIIGGTVAVLGEFPHMVAIGYRHIGNDQLPYSFRCGGSLIDKRFVLTAAHCVSRTENQPSIVRLGITDFTSEEQMKNKLDLAIKSTHIHPDYRSLSKYHDIAILELENDVEYSANIHPACLYTNPNDPPDSASLNVTGWGITSLKTQEQSNNLLKASVEIVPLNRCNDSYTAQLSRGVLDSQLCAHDASLMSDACWGDSGGPLNMIVNQTYNDFRIVGVISAGEGCASATPSLYTRVSAYLDFIESKVWADLT